jgi:ferrous iron transport protein A
MNELSDRLRRRRIRPLAGREQSPRPLAALAPGARAVVVGLREQDSALARRLCDLGFTPGTQVEVLRRAPLGDPVVYRLRDCEICLRARQAGIIDVEELP